MKYAISLLRVEQPEYKPERYDTFEEAEVAFMKIPASKRADLGIAEIHTEEEIAAMNVNIE